MKLYTVPAAPNPTKVMLYIAEREVSGTDMGIEQVRVNTLKGEQNSPEHLQRNPFGALPVLELDDGRYLSESLSIIHFLDEKFADNNMLGSDPIERSFARDLERIVELRIAIPIGRYVHVTNSPFGLPADPKAAAEIEASLPKALGFIEKMLSDGRSLLLGDSVSIADCTLQSGLQFARFGKSEVISDYPNIQAWDQAYRARPAALSVLKF
jgi:glutathione S-transferase|tara:strand:+ start:2278 stop:2910 length:633 start_codon:yes stop_codon:yes gene_type:complete